KLIDVAAGKEIAVLPRVANISLAQLSGVSPMLKLSPDGKILAGYCPRGSDNTVTLWDVATQQSRVLKIAPPRSNRNSVLCAEFSPDGKLLAAGFGFQWVTVWDVATGTVKLQFSQKPSMMSVSSVAFSPSGKTLAVGTDVGAVTLWDVETGKPLVAF